MVYAKNLQTKKRKEIRVDIQGEENEKKGSVEGSPKWKKLIERERKKSPSDLRLRILKKAFALLSLSFIYKSS